MKGIQMLQNNDWFEYGNSLPVNKREIYFMDLANKTRLTDELLRENILPVAGHLNYFRILWDLEDYIDKIPETMLKKYL